MLEAARSSAAQIIARLTASEQLQAGFRATPHALSEEEQATTRVLDAMDRTGRVPRVGGQRKQDTAQLLFLTLADVAPLFMLTLTLGQLRAPETAELPADHTVTREGVVVVRLDEHMNMKAGTAPVRWETRGEGHSSLESAVDFYLLLASAHHAQPLLLRHTAAVELVDWTRRQPQRSRPALPPRRIDAAEHVGSPAPPDRRRRTRPHRSSAQPAGHRRPVPLLRSAPSGKRSPALWSA